MRVLVVGAGGREHALCWKISQSPLLSELYCAPGNPGTASLAQNVPIAVDQIDRLALFAKEKQIDLTVVGPEQPLALGIVDVFQEKGLLIFGPVRESARLEASKVFAKEVMAAAGVLTAAWRSFTDRREAEKYLRQLGHPVVLKADGLAAGKGVFVCHCEEQVQAALDAVFGVLGSGQVVIEQFLEGVEASLIVAVANDIIVPLATSHDYKRLLQGDQGPNTGGMGSISPTSRLSIKQEELAIEGVIRPVLKELKSRGLAFCGFLYAGLMLTGPEEFQVLEFNVRLGDPEAQSILRRMDSDLLEALLLMLDRQVPCLSWSSELAICVVLAGADYPQRSSQGDEISGIDFANQLPEVVVFHAGTTAKPDGKVVTAGGRVLAVTARGANLELARRRAFAGVGSIEFRGMQYRSDIGADG